ncbi:DUF3616 domain-containing protein [Bosea caraganae]|uniref:DUF3616 domain-containing protein n=1 Tax=Bosea caraganae TaxID=2763117 RepID=A0A370KYH0_9HYPH|nr:DUF3616 domain-containing protein [Bosea caraganae]RDJ20035.1 DUF3616 domain-containing protein [Bosea caraganae]RDJ25642.1 DUF3616 domain-containing protein [Bosea caraganae]
MTRLVFVLVAVAAILTAMPASAKPLKPERSIEATGDFEGKKPGKPARDVSGMACLPAVDGERRCLLGNDENIDAQFATLKGKRITPGKTIALIGTAPSPAALGARPSVACPKQGGYGEFDSEGAAFAAPYFYVTGSHGCSRNSGEFRLSSFQLARIRVDAAGKPEGPAELTYRLGDALRRAAAAGSFFGKDLMSADGLNVEGLAVSGDQLWAGLRAPAPAGKAVLVGTSVAALFAAGSDPLKAAIDTVTFDAGKGRGIRDLAALRDGRLVALVGPRQEQGVPYALILVDPRQPAAARELGELPDRKKAKAEVVALLAETPDSLSILVGYDGLKDGGFEEYRLQLK